MDLWIAVIAGLPGLILGGVNLYQQLKKNPHEIAKTDAEAEKTRAERDDIHSQVADRWAEHVCDLMKKVEMLEGQHDLHKQLREAENEEVKGIRMDIAQVRRENEEYRRENSDLKDWAERLVMQLTIHAPNVSPEKFISRSV